MKHLQEQQLTWHQGSTQPANSLPRAEPNPNSSCTFPISPCAKPQIPKPTKAKKKTLKPNKFSMPVSKTHIPTYKYTQIRVYIRELVPGKSSKALNERGRRLTRVDWWLWGRWSAGKRGRALVPVGSPGAIHMPYTSSSLIWFSGYCDEVEIWELEGLDQRDIRACGRDLMHFLTERESDAPISVGSQPSQAPISSLFVVFFLLLLLLVLFFIFYFSFVI